MKVIFIGFFIAAIVAIECSHTFLGTNVQRELVFKKGVRFSSRLFQKRVETLNITIPNKPLHYGQSIQGILAYDLTKTTASVNVTGGGLGFDFVTLRMKSERGKELRYEIYIYV